MREKVELFCAVMSATDIVPNNMHSYEQFLHVN